MTELKDRHIKAKSSLAGQVDTLARTAQTQHRWVASLNPFTLYQNTIQTNLVIDMLPNSYD